MKLAIVGGRDFLDVELLDSTLAKLGGDVTCVVSGGAAGADTLGENWAIANGIPRIIHIPKWRVNGVYNNRAGFERNELIINDADVVIAFWDGESPGTKSSIGLAKKAGKQLHVIAYAPKPKEVFTEVKNEHHQYFRTDEDGKRILQCHSKGAKEFSPFFCHVEAFGETRSIEDHYQSMKVFEGPEGQLAKAKDWKDAKTMQDLGIDRVGFELPNGFKLGNYNEEVTDLPIQYYIGLWHKYLRKNPQLIKVASEYDGFEDIFEGKFPFSQAKVIAKCVAEGVESLFPMYEELRTHLKTYADYQKKADDIKKGS